MESGFADLLHAFGPAAEQLLSPVTFAWMILGVATGLVVGIVPGFGGTQGMALLLPFLYGMRPVHGIVLMISAIAVIHTADTFPAVLLGVPGSSAAAADVMDGFPLAQQGKAKMALGAAFSASAIGGVIGASILLFSVPIAMPLILAMSAPQLFALSVLGLSLVAILSGSKPSHGLAMAAFGLLLGCIGGAPTTPVYRYTFGTLYLMEGVRLVILAFGLFAIPEIIGVLASRHTIAEGSVMAGSTVEGLRETLRNWKLVVEHSLVGVLLGFIPGVGGAVIDWINYGLARQTVRNNWFGRGDVRGLIAPESGNHSKEGGALIPALFFGIPGSSTNAMILGGLILLGIDPGPSMVGEHLDLTLTFVLTLAIANIFGAAVFLGLSTWIAKLTTISFRKIAPFLFIINALGALQASRSLGDIGALLCAGLVGWITKSLNWPRPPLLVGFVLADAVERNLWLSSARYGVHWLFMPSVVAILAVATLLAFAGYRWRQSSELDRSDSASVCRAQSRSYVATEFAVEFILFGLFIWAAYSASGFEGYSRLLPMVASLAGAAVLITRMASFWRRRRRAAGTNQDVLPGKRYFLWFAAYLASIVVIGFVPAAMLLLISFAVLESRASWYWGATSAVVVLAVLLLLQHYMPGLWPSGVVHVT
jgi:putative tricarboxylic transport membrane protein